VDSGVTPNYGVVIFVVDAAFAVIDFEVRGFEMQRLGLGLKRKLVADVFNLLDAIDGEARVAGDVETAPGCAGS
jgi:hypothetical protein